MPLKAAFSFGGSTGGSSASKLTRLWQNSFLYGHGIQASLLPQGQHQAECSPGKAGATFSWNPVPPIIPPIFHWLKASQFLSTFREEYHTKARRPKVASWRPSQNLFTKVRCYFNCQKISRQEGHYCCFKICLYVFFIFSSSSAVPWNWAGYSDSFPTKRIWWSAGEWLLRQKALGPSLWCLAWITHSEETSGQVTRTLKQSCWTGCVSRNRERAPVKSQPRVSANN